MQLQTERSVQGQVSSSGTNRAETTTSPTSPQTSPLLSQVSSMIRQPTLGKTNRIGTLQRQGSSVAGLSGLRHGSIPSNFTLQQQLSGLGRQGSVAGQASAKPLNQLVSGSSVVSEQQAFLSSADSLPGQIYAPNLEPSTGTIYFRLELVHLTQPIDSRGPHKMMLKYDIII